MYVRVTENHETSLDLYLLFFHQLFPALSQCNMRTDGVCRTEPVYKYVVGF